MKQHSYLLEIVAALALLTIVNLVWVRDNLGFVMVSPHPYWIPVLALAIKYDLRAALAAAGVSSVVYGLFLLLFHDVSFAQGFAYQYFKPVLLFFVVGGFIGQMRSNQSKQLAGLEENKAALQKRYDLLKKRSSEIARLKDELAERIIGQTSTVSTVSQLAKKLDILDLECLPAAALDFLVQVAGVEKCSFYKWDRDLQTLKLEATSGWLQKDEERYETNVNNDMFRQALVNRRPVALTESFGSDLESAPETVEADAIMSAPILVGRSKMIYGLINVEKLPFLKFNPDTIQMFSTVADWISHSVTLAQEIQKRQDSMDKSEQFDRHIQESFEGPFAFGTPLSEMRQQSPRGARQ